jgi:SNF2 family DNA or RNA helicase
MTVTMLQNVRAEVKGDRIVLNTELRDKELVKKVPGHKWHQNAREWSVPLSWAAMVQLRGVFGDRLEIGDELLELGRRAREHRVEPCMALRDAPEADWVDEPQLTPLQRAAVAFMATARQAFEGDPMGSGKTPITICALKQLEDPFPALVVCTSGGKFHWRDEFATWWPGVEVSVVAGNVKQRRAALERPAHVYAVNWEILLKHSRLAGYGSIRLGDKEKEPKELNGIEFKTMIVDEAHRAKDPKAKQTRAAFAIADAVASRGGNVFALTGSLAANSPEDLWAPARIVCPAEYPSKVAFVERYGLLSWNHFGGLEVVGLRGDTREELFKFLDPRLIRRPKEAILPELEGKLPPIVRTVDLPSKQRKAYDKLRKEMLVDLDGGVLMASNPMTRVLRLRQLAAATGELDENGNMTLKEPSAKLDELLAVLEELGDDQVAVYAESRQLIELAAARLEKAGVPCCMYTGAVDHDQREADRKSFQDGDVRVILLTYGAGAESINLSAADAVVQLELSWSMIKNNQALERPQRPGRKGPLRQVTITAHDTVDEVVASKYRDKLDMLEQIVRDEETLRKWLS